MNKVSTPFKLFLILIACYASFQYGRVHDDGVLVDQPEYDHRVISDRVKIVTDSNGNPYSVVWEKNGEVYSFTYCSDCLDNL